ncbi:hypothetical protein JHK82_043427 [Glycine max]|nr:hypothetical protein JHK82_043427 [Glycine max]
MDNRIKMFEEITTTSFRVTTVYAYLCMKLETGKDIVMLGCLIDENCYDLCPHCGCTCVNALCKCYPEDPLFTNNNHTQAP